MPFLNVALSLDGLNPDEAERAFEANGALAMTLTDERDDAILEPAPGEIRLWPATRLAATFDAETASPTLLASLAARLGVPVSRLEIRTLADRVWEREWLKDYHAMRFGQRLWVCPAHERVDDSGAIIVHLDPGLAFGTGTHPTTAMCLEWLDAHLAPGSSVIDYGCGSGILGIAAVKLGAIRAEAFDIDPQALIATRDNASRNSVAERLVTHAAATDLAVPADLLLANILSGPLVELAPRLANLVRTGGSIVLAGLLATQSDEVADAYRNWFHITPAASRAEWVLLTGVRRSA